MGSSIDIGHAYAINQSNQSGISEIRSRRIDFATDLVCRLIIMYNDIFDKFQSHSETRVFGYKHIKTYTTYCFLHEEI